MSLQKLIALFVVALTLTMWSIAGRECVESLGRHNLLHQAGR